MYNLRMTQGEFLTFFISEPIEASRLRELAGSYGDMVKAVVDTDRRVMALGGDLHSDEEAILLEQGFRTRKSLGN